MYKDVCCGKPSTFIKRVRFSATWYLNPLSFKAETKQKHQTTIRSHPLSQVWNWPGSTSPLGKSFHLAAQLPSSLQMVFLAWTPGSNHCYYNFLENPNLHPCFIPSKVGPSFPCSIILVPAMWIKWIMTSPCICMLCNIRIRHNNFMRMMCPWKR